jgi:hypothetical protein
VPIETLRGLDADLEESCVLGMGVAERQDVERARGVAGAVFRRDAETQVGKPLDALGEVHG